MKKLVLASAALIALLFGLITFLKHNPADQEADARGKELSAEQQKILQFWATFRKATDLRMEGRWQEAAELYEESMRLNPKHEDSRYYLGNMRLELKQYPQAESAWLGLASVNPGNARAYLQLAHLYLIPEGLFDVGKAEVACRKALQINKEETGPVLTLGEIKLLQGRNEEAASFFHAVKSSNFKSKEAYFLLGYLAWKAGDADKARKDFANAVKYAKPTEKNPQKVIGEGDTRQSQQTGPPPSKSIFLAWMKDLQTVPEGKEGESLPAYYQRLDTYLSDLKRNVH